MAVDWVEEQIVRHEWTGNVDNISYGDILVRCKDCKHIGDMYKCPVFYSKEKQSDDWYCADGKKKG